jgi:hypothetical protein
LHSSGDAPRARRPRLAALVVGEAIDLVPVVKVRAIFEDEAPVARSGRKSGRLVDAPGRGVVGAKGKYLL